VAELTQPTKVPQRVQKLIHERNNRIVAGEDARGDILPPRCSTCPYWVKVEGRWWNVADGLTMHTVSFMDYDAELEVRAFLRDRQAQSIRKGVLTVIVLAFLIVMSIINL
jgi:hypothetical protein